MDCMCPHLTVEDISLWKSEEDNMPVRTVVAGSGGIFSPNTSLRPGYAPPPPPAPSPAV